MSVHVAREQRFDSVLACVARAAPVVGDDGHRDARVVETVFVGGRQPVAESVGEEELALRLALEEYARDARRGEIAGGDIYRADQRGHHCGEEIAVQRVDGGSKVQAKRLLHRPGIRRLNHLFLLGAHAQP